MATTTNTTTNGDITTVTATAVAASRPIYPLGIPEKFSVDGDVRYYPGNTTLCHLPSDSPLLPGLRALYDAYSTHPILSRKMKLLPPASWHMTVFDGVRERECEPGMWPTGVVKVPLKQSTAEFAVKLKAFGQQLENEGLAPPYRMRVTSFDDGTVGCGLVIEGATDEEEKRMRRLRDRIGDTLGFRAPNHETYGFHISTLYLLRHMDGADREDFERVRRQFLPVLQQEFELGSVEFCTFDNMFEFPRQFYLGQESE